MNKGKRNKKLRSNSAVTKDMTFAEILNSNPKAANILMKKGMHCIVCGMAMHETLEQGALMHGLNPDKLVKEINAGTNKKPSTKIKRGKK